MTTRRLPFIVLLLAAALAVLACGKKGPDDSKVIATVNGEPITETEYNSYLNARQSEHGAFR